MQKECSIVRTPAGFDRGRPREGLRRKLDAARKLAREWASINVERPCRRSRRNAIKVIPGDVVQVRRCGRVGNYEKKCEAKRSNHHGSLRLTPAAIMFTALGHWQG